MAAPTELKQEINIPTGVELILKDKTVQVKGPKGTYTRILHHPKINLAVQKNTIVISCNQRPHKKEKALVGTFTAHLNNMIRGVTEGFEYKMKTVFSHFPIKTVVEGNTFIIQNFLGERYPRKAQILEGIKVTIEGELITISGIDKENVGQTAANIERATKVKNRDIRVFQDGIYIISRKEGKL